MIVAKKINPRFEDFLWDWDYNKYLLLGGYGSSKSYHIALKLVLKCLEEKRVVLVVREVYDTHRDSTFSLFCEILEDMGLLEENNSRKKSKKVICKESPFTLRFPNGSKIIFRGMDKPKKLKSINGITIVWLEEASEIKYEGYKELLGRLRHPTLSLHFILSSNPVGTENWLYKHFFKRINEDGEEVVVLDDERLYKKRTVVKKGVYYHHSLPDDNLFLPESYIRQLDELAEYDPDLYRTARLGRFGLNGIKVLPRFEIASSHQEVMAKVAAIPSKFRFNGMDFGFETSYNAVVRMAVDDKEKILYIYWEYYKNHTTDDITAEELKGFGLDKVPIIADCAEPKTIKYYQQQGFRMSRCKKAVKNGVGSRLQNIRKVKRFKKIVCSPLCSNTIRELNTLTYKKNDRDEIIYDEFNIDPHTFSAIWYGLNDYTVADLKRIDNNRKGAA